MAVLGDAEKVAVEYLRAHAGVGALVSTRVYTRIPETPEFPLVRLFRIGGIPRVEGWLDEASLQVDSWAEDKYAAAEVARTVQDALWQMSGVRSGSVVADVRTTLGMRWSPDPETGRPRYLFGVAVRLHPVPA